MSEFEKAYKALNEQQRQAVNTIDGPLLVVAGPGTGKTQLLGMRVANIIKQTDTVPANILCLTFTDNAARNMRERLVGIIGQPAYHVAIHTFHSFGGEVINQYGDFFTGRQLLQQIDELGRYELLQSIFEDLPHSNPLSAKVGEDFIFLKDSLELISWLKQNGLTPAELHALLAANHAHMEALSDDITTIFETTPSAGQIKNYQLLLKKIQAQQTGQFYFGFAEYTAQCAKELDAAIAATKPTGKYAPPITAWRNSWCQKNAKGQHVFKDAGQNLRKMQAVAGVYQKLLDKMSARGLYDFDDMIMETVHALEASDELRLNLQERYQYIVVDEFQDTNKAQLRLLVALGNNPVNEGRPNIMAVGDDDQAIYAFQGAEVSNMSAFVKLYSQAKLITLRDNYRSTPDIISASTAVATQITDRLEQIVAGTNKHLQAKATHPNGKVRHSTFASELSQYDWIAEQIKKLVDRGALPEDIGVIAPRHRYLERLVPYLGNRHIPVAYERRENILEAPIIKQLLTMAELVVALADNRQDDIDALLGQVLGYDFWQIDANVLLELSLKSYADHRHWLEVASSQPSKKVRVITAWFIGLAKASQLEPLEYILDELMGNEPGGPDNENDEPLALPIQTMPKFKSPMREFYFNPSRYEQATEHYLTLLGQLSSLRQQLRLWQPTQMLYTKDLVGFAKLHSQAKLKVIDTNPHTVSTNAVQVMTAYKAKGLEFGTVFVINLQDEIWGPTARSRTQRITLPKNLPIAPASDGDNDKLRLLFVALTRAKHTLQLTSYTHNLDGKLSPGLSFIDISNQDSGTVHPIFRPQLIDKPATPAAIEILSTDWAYRFRQIIADKPALLEPILTDYRLSVTHLNNFIDVSSGGPQHFFLHNLLRFPEAPTPSAAYGDVVHKTLQWIFSQLRQNNKLPTRMQVNRYFSDLLSRKHLRHGDYKRLDKRGQQALQLYIAQRGKTFNTSDLVERNFSNEGVIIGNARLSGKIDLLHLDGKGSAEVVDFKTGKPVLSWQGKDDYEKIKLHRYRQQLLFYKLLVEHSASFSGKLSVSSGALEFIEAADDGELVTNLELPFDTNEIEQFTKLISAVWRRIQALDIPDTSDYAPNMQGIKAFEKNLLEN